jgi:hypothetical protein
MNGTLNPSHLIQNLINNDGTTESYGFQRCRTLPGGSHDDGVGTLVRLLYAGHLGLALDPDQKRDEEGRRLAGTSLGNADDVSVGQA